MKPRKKKGGLVLTRKPHRRHHARSPQDSVVLTHEDIRIVVKVCNVDGKQVKLHFAAPPEVKIVRGEIEGEED